HYPSRLHLLFHLRHAAHIYLKTSVHSYRDITDACSSAISHSSIEHHAYVGILRELFLKKIEQIAVCATDDEDMACHDPPDNRPSAHHETFPLQFVITTHRLQIGNKFSATPSLIENTQVLEPRSAELRTRTVKERDDVSDTALA